jgi:hypothetical protein
MRLSSLYMQAPSLRYSTVLTNRAGGQSTYKLWLRTSLQERAAFPVNHEILLVFLNEISLSLIIQGAQFINSTCRFTGLLVILACKAGLVVLISLF